MNNIYESIATRTNGNIYVGVVGPVRTGKSTFITRFMEQIVIPNMEKTPALTRMMDELPQSGSGKQVMTMEPRFVPNEPVSVTFGKAKASLRLVDCVGYMVSGATGHIGEDGTPRLVRTPWAKEPITFQDASEIGTSKVISEHSTVGILITTDGTITDIDRNDYIEAEERTVRELKALGKPFIIILNSIAPESEEAKRLAQAMIEKYEVAVLIKDVQEMMPNDFEECFKKLLYEFPVQKITFNLPSWLGVTGEDNPIIGDLLASIAKVKIEKMAQFADYDGIFSENSGILNPLMKEIELGTGEINFDINTESRLFYETLSTITGGNILNERELMQYIAGASVAKTQYDKLSLALAKAEESGYGVVVPSAEEMKLFEPEIIKKGGSSGLRLRASAPSLHIMRVDVEAEVTPAVGGLIGEIKEDGGFDGDADAIWNTNMFGRTMVDVAHDTILSKLNTFPEEAELKMRKTLSKITNEGKGGIICILL